jgi:predicted Zn finger-like uncharacterized protein
MLLATKCPHCKTTFKVANDQLKLQSGLVRCGVCQQVFNGIEHLAPANTGGTSIKINPAATPPVAEPLPAAIPDPASASTPILEQAVSTAPDNDTEPPQTDLFASFNIPLEPEPATTQRIEPLFDSEPVQTPESNYPAPLKSEFIMAKSDEELEKRVQALLDQDIFAEQSSLPSADPDTADHEEIVIDKIEDLDNTFSAVPMVPEEVPAELESLDDAFFGDDPLLDRDDTEPTLEGEEDDEAEPESTKLGELLDHGDETDIGDRRFEDDELEQLLFIRQARHRQRLKWILSFGALLLMLTLVGQIAYQFRDWIAQAYPSSRDSLVLFCKVAGCQVRLPAQLDAVSYEADELHTLARPGTFEFGMLLKNHNNLTQAWPSIELTLKDNKKQVVLKKVFAPSDYLSGPREELAGFAPNSEQPVKLYFVDDKLQATDYVVVIFFP